MKMQLLLITLVFPMIAFSSEFNLNQNTDLKTGDYGLARVQLYDEVFGADRLVLVMCNVGTESGIELSRRHPGALPIEVRPQKADGPSSFDLRILSDQDSPETIHVTCSK